MANNNKGTATILAVVVTAAVAGIGGYFIGDRAGGQAGAQMETAAVATVNNETITKEDLYTRMLQQGGGEAVRDLINEKLVDQEAAKAGVTVTAAEVDAEIKKITERLGGEEALKGAMEQNGITLDQLKKYQDFRLKATKILSKDIVLDDAALKAYFDENIATFDKREVHARHILVNTEEEAKAVRAELDKGADFAKLAAEKSIEPAAATSGGDLGTFGRGRMVPAFETAAFSMKKGEISQPVKSDFGWHIIEVLETKGTAPNFEAMKAEVKEAVLAEQIATKLTPWLEELTAKAKITNTLAK